MYQLPRASITNDHLLGGLKITEMYSLTVQEAPSLKSGFP